MSDDMSATPTRFSVEQVMGEIHEEVRRRRAVGDLPAGLEQELDAVFARFAPAGTAEEHFDDLLDKVERASFIDPNAPVASNLPGGQRVKNTIRRATGFAIQHLAEQMSAFDYAAVRTLRRLDERLRVVEQAPAYAPSWTTAVSPGGPDLAPWGERIAAELSGGPGRVLHADAGEGALVQLLRAKGIDAYGTEPTAGAAAQAPPGVEIRESTVLEHLSALADGVLGGLVLSGSVDVLPRPSQLAVVARAAQVLRGGAVLALVGTTPDAWAASVSPVVADLSDGRPLHAETWAHVLAGGPFSPPEVVRADAGSTYLVLAVRT
jgi:hypothetical protein